MQYVTYGSGGISSSTTDFSIGNRNWSYGVSFDGAIDDVRIFQEALSLSEIQKLYADDLERKYFAKR